MGVFFQDPDIRKNIFHFPASPAINDTLSVYLPTSGTGSLNSVEIRFAIQEIFARKRKRARSAGNGGGVGEVRKATTVSLSTLMTSACTSQIRPRSDSPFLRNAPTDGHTDTQTDTQTHRQTPLLYIYIDSIADIRDQFWKFYASLYSVLGCVKGVGVILTT